MNISRVIVVFLALVIKTNISFAHNEHNHHHSCDVSKATLNDYEPKQFATTNNLLRKTGEESMFCGEMIVVYGKVVDQNCKPVADAKIYAWQADCKGKYPYQPLKEKVVDKELITYDPGLTFLGNGIATTNNKGEFYFVTVYPSPVHGLGPHINIRVEPYEGMSMIQTRLVLSGHKVRNRRSDPDLKSISESASKNGMSIYKFKVVIPGVVVH